MEERNDIVIYQSEDGLVRMEAMVDSQHETIWATQKAIAALFGKDVSDISRHIRNVYTRGELTEDSTLQKMQIAFSDKPVQYYNLDMIISVGYRVNSVRATQFRIWATSIIKQYMLKGYVVNHNVVSEQKYEDLKRAMGLLENVFNKELLLSSDQVTDLFDVIRDYTYALDTLDAYDYQSLKIADTTVPERFHATYENAVEARGYSKTFPSIFSTIFTATPPLFVVERWQQYGRCGELASKALLAPDCCRLDARMTVII